jgi:hypothetical protein
MYADGDRDSEIEKASINNGDCELERNLLKSHKKTQKRTHPDQTN